MTELERRLAATRAADLAIEQAFAKEKRRVRNAVVVQTAETRQIVFNTLAENEVTRYFDITSWDEFENRRYDEGYELCILIDRVGCKECKRMAISITGHHHSDNISVRETIPESSYLPTDASVREAVMNYLEKTILGHSLSRLDTGATGYILRKLGVREG